MSSHVHQISAHGIGFTAGWEAFVPYVYDDKARLVRVGGKLAPPQWSGGAVLGTLTIGYGHTDAARHPMKCHDMVGKTISEAEAREILRVDMGECEAAVNADVTVPIAQGQFDALADFAFNCGRKNLRLLIAPLNRGDAAGTRRNFDHFVRSKGEVMTGLQRRRDAEQILWDEADRAVATPAATPAAVPVDNGDGDFVETPKELDAPSPPKSLGDSNIVKGAATAATAIAPPVAGAAIKASTDTPPDVAPTVIDHVTNTVDRAGQVIETTRTVTDLAPALPKGFWASAGAILTDPVIVCVFGVLALMAIGYVVFERRRKLHEELV